MLVHLSVHNYAIVEHLDLELATGMSVITGETGAGKSIMLDALGLTSATAPTAARYVPERTRPTFSPASTSAPSPRPATGSPSATWNRTVRASCAG